MDSTTKVNGNLQDPLEQLLKLLQGKKNVVEYLKLHPGMNINACLEPYKQTALQTWLSLYWSTTAPLRQDNLDALLNYPGIQVDEKGSSNLTPLFSIIQDFHRGQSSKESISVVEKLLKKGADVNTVDEEMGMTLMMFCFEKHYSIDLNLMLLNQPGIQLTKAINGRNACSYWLGKIHYNDYTIERISFVLDCFLKQNLNIRSDESMNNKVPVFHCLVEQYSRNVDIDLLKRIIQEVTFDPNQGDPEGVIPLMLAAKKGEIDLAKVLLQQKQTCINFTDNDNMSALMYSSTCEMFKLLLLHDSTEVNIISKPGLTAARHCLSLKCETELQSMFQHPKYQVNQVQEDGLTDLLWACSKTKYKRGGKVWDDSLYPYLLQCKEIDVSVSDSGGKNALCYMSSMWRIDVMDVFLGHISVQSEEKKLRFLNNQDVDGKTFLHVLCSTETPCLDKTSLASLREVIHQADINLQDKQDYTPIMRLIESNSNNAYDADIVLMLLEHPSGCDLSKTNIYKQNISALQKIGSENSSLHDKVRSLISTALGESDLHRSFSSLPPADQLKILRSSMSTSGFTRDQQQHINFLLGVVDETFNAYSQGVGVNIGDDEHRKKIMDSFRFLVEQLEVREVVDFLLQDGILTQFEYEKINSKETRHERVTSFLSVLLIRDKRGFECFIKALETTSQEFIAKELLRPKTCTDLVVKENSLAASVFKLEIPEDKRLSSLAIQFADM